MKKAAATLLVIAVSALAACHTTRNAQSVDSFTASMRSDSATISTSTSESRAMMLKDDSTFITIVDIEYLYPAADSAPLPAKARVRQIAKHSHAATASHTTSTASDTTRTHTSDTVAANATSTSSQQSSHTPPRNPAAAIIILLTFILICYDYYTHHKN